MSDTITREEMLLNSIANYENSNLTPITREEQYLSYIAGETNTHPVTPITRKEKFLDKIVKNGLGSGGVGLNVQPLNVTENGTYTAPSGIAYSPVNVQVKAESGGGSSGGSSGSTENRLAMLVSDTLTEITEKDLEGATKIATYSLYQRKNLRAVTIPSSVTTIEKGAFGGSGLTSITIPDSVTSIGAQAFYECRNIESIVIPASVESLPGSSLSSCSSMTTVVINGAITIENYAFNKSDALKILVLRGNTVCTLNALYAFAGTPFLYDDGSSWAGTGTGGTCYVPQALIESYKTATNWSALYEAGTCNFVAIEGSEYE